MNGQQESTRYEIFKASAQADIAAYRKDLKADGTFSYVDQVTQLERLSINMSGKTLIYLFGDLLGTHLWEKFVVECQRNLLHFFRQLTSEYKFYILHELKNNDMLFANS